MEEEEEKHGDMEYILFCSTRNGVYNYRSNFRLENGGGYEMRVLVRGERWK